MRALDMCPTSQVLRPMSVISSCVRDAKSVRSLALNYSKRKQTTAVDVERHPRSKGVLCPCNDFLARHSEEMAS